MRLLIKQLSLQLFLLMFVGGAFAQVDVQLSLASPANLTLDALSQRLTGTMINTSSEPITINFSFELTSNYGLSINSPRIFLNDIDLEAGEMRQLDYDDWSEVFSSNVIILPAEEELFLRDNQLFKQGNYTICLKAKTANTNIFLSEGCTTFTAQGQDPPEIIFPNSDQFELSQKLLPLRVDWFQIPHSPVQYKIEIADATYLGTNIGLAGYFEQAPQIYMVDDISSFNHIVEDIDWEVDHTYAIRVSSYNELEESVTGKGVIHSRPRLFKYISEEDTTIVASVPKDNTEEEVQSEGEIAEVVTPEPTGKEESAPVIVVVPANNIPGTVTINDTIYVGTYGEFKVILSELTGTKSAYNGKGTVFIDWLQARVNVSFKNITIAENKQILTGNVIADLNDNPPTYPIDWALEAVTSNTWTNTMAGEVVDWAEGISGEEVPYKNLNELSTPLSMPFGLNFGAENKLVLTEMAFNKDKSQFNIIVAKSTPLDWGEAQTVGFIAKNVSFHPASIDPTPKRLELVSNVAIEDTNLNTSYTFIAPTDDRAGCYIEWGENGFSNFGLELENELSRKWLVPINDNGNDRVKITLTAQSSGWDNLLFTGNLSPSEVVGTGGIQIEAQEISYDMSDVLNPNGITFPTNYKLQTNNLFRGFYAKNLNLKLPEAWETSTNGALEINANNMIIDNMGLTISAEAINIASFNTTSVTDMAASVDKATVVIIANSLTEASIEGKLALPISDVTKITDDSKINYSASLHTANKKASFQLVLNPTTDQEIDFDLISSKFKLDRTSNITAYVGDDKKTFAANLSGSVSLSGIDIGPISLNAVGMDVENLNFAYDSRPAKGFTFNEDKTMVWGKHSPQKQLSSSSSNKGFSVSFLSIEYEDKIKEAGDFMRGALLITTQVVLSDNIGGEGTIAITGAIKKDNNSFAKFKPVYVKTTLEKIHVEADVSAVKIVGDLTIRESDPVYGDGFKGELLAEFKTLKASVTAVAEFGTVQNYNYWRVQAGLDLPTPILLAAGISFYGVGGGAYNNMKATATNNASWAKKYTFTPKKNVAGLSLMARLGAPKFETYNADVEIKAEIGTGPNAGIREIEFTGNLWVGATLEERAKAPIKGVVGIKYDFVNSIFDLAADASVNMKAITAKDVGMKIHANGTTDKWFFKFGDPTDPNTINVNLLGLGIDVDSYFMFGNDIPIPGLFTTNFREGYKAALGKYPGFDPTTEATSEGSNAQHGAGIALGVGFNFKAGGHIPLALGYYGGISGTAGAELNLSLLEYPILRNQGLGYNGWQAGGSIGFYASVAAGIYSKNSKGNYVPEFMLADFAGGGYIAGRFPNPVWAKGEISGRVKALCLLGGCVIDTGVDIGFEYGDEIARGNPDVKVKEAEVNELVIETKDAVLENIDKHIVKYVHPKTPFSFSPTSPIAVKYYATPNEIFELPDLNRLRFFNFKTTVSLEEINPMTCKPVMIPLYVSTNDIGEKLYTGESNLSWPGRSSNLNTNQQNAINSIGALGNNPLSSSTSSNFSNTITNNLAPRTNYRLVISVILREKINGHWGNALLDGKEIEDIVEYKFRTSGFRNSASNVFASSRITDELAAADALFTEMKILDFYNLSLEEQFILNGGLSNLANENITDQDRFFISEDGKCECVRLDAMDKLKFFTDEREGRNSHETLVSRFGETKSYRDYPYNRSTADAILRLANQPINSTTNSATNLNISNEAATTHNYSPSTFNYNTVNTATEGSFLSLNLRH